MPKLLKNITANILNTFTSNVRLFKTLNTQFGEGDYVKVYGIEAFLQDYSQINITENLNKSLNFGLQINSNFTILEISY